jgi:[ribosomal protein S5]-alanine N-acetyltransferase
MTVAAGTRLVLRRLESADVTAEYQRWMNDPEINQFLESRFVPITMESLHEYVARFRDDPANVLLAIRERDGDRHVGNIKIGPIDRHHDVAEVGLVIGAKDCWGRGYATEAIGLASRYAFQQLGLRRLTAGAYSTNIGSIRAFEKAGYSREGVGRRHYRSAGGYADRVLLGLLADEAARQ